MSRQRSGQECDNLRNQIAQLKKENATLKNQIDSLSKSSAHKANRYLYLCWANFKQFYTNPKSGSYKYYGAKSSMYPEWIDSSKAFIEWVLLNIGDRPKDGDFKLMRIDSKKGVEPGNLKWGTSKECAKKKVRQLDLDGNLIAIHPSVEEAKRAAHPDGGGSLSRVLNSKRPTLKRKPPNYHKGYLWEFE